MYKIDYIDSDNNYTVLYCSIDDTEIIKQIRKNPQSIKINEQEQKIKFNEQEFNLYGKITQSQTCFEYKMYNTKQGIQQFILPSNTYNNPQFSNYLNYFNIKDRKTNEKIEGLVLAELLGYVSLKSQNVQNITILNDDLEMAKQQLQKIELDLAPNQFKVIPIFENGHWMTMIVGKTQNGSIEYKLYDSLGSPINLEQTQRHNIIREKYNQNIELLEESQLQRDYSFKYGNGACGFFTANCCAECLSQENFESLKQNFIDKTIQKQICKSVSETIDPLLQKNCSFGQRNDLTIKDSACLHISNVRKLYSLEPLNSTSKSQTNSRTSSRSRK